MLGRKRGRDDGEMVRDLGIVKDAFVRPDPLVLQNLAGKRAVVGPLQHPERRLNRADVILWQRARVGSWIREHLVFFVECLRQRERGLGGKPEPPIRLPLQARQIVQQPRQLRRRFAFFGDDAKLAQALGADRFGQFRIPDPLRLQVAFAVLFGELLVEPPPGVFARLSQKRAVDFPVILRDEILDAVLTLDEDRQRGRLHAAHGREVKPARLRVERRHRPGAVDADQPIRFGTAYCRIRQREHGNVRPQLREPLPNGRGRHGLQPKAFDGLLGFRVLQKVAENQLPFTASVASVDQRIHVRALNQFEQHFEPPFALFDWPQIEMRRNHRQIGK